MVPYLPVSFFVPLRAVHSPRMRRLLAGLFLAAGCSEGEVQLSVPTLDTAHVVFGTAAAGRSLFPFAVEVEPTPTVTSVTPVEIGGGHIDMLFAGLDPSDLPLRGASSVTTPREHERFHAAFGAWFDSTSPSRLSSVRLAGS